MMSKKESRPFCLLLFENYAHIGLHGRGHPSPVRVGSGRSAHTGKRLAEAAGSPSSDPLYLARVEAGRQFRAKGNGCL